jgi:hypothetical protein
VILFCVATGTDHGSVGIIDRDAVHVHPGVHCAQSREWRVHAHGQRPRYAYGHPGGCRDWDSSVTTLRELLAVVALIQNISGLAQGLAGLSMAG